MNISRKMKGLTLIEVMVSMAILAFALLGIAALHGLGTKFGNKAYFRSQAIAQAYDIVDRIRANSAAVGTNYVRVTLPTTPGNCDSSACSAYDLATYDLAKWNTANSTLLPNGSGAITISGADVTVVVNWVEDSNNDGTADPHSVSITAQI
jgi:type IV pilus assembly protein PilV